MARLITKFKYLKPDAVLGIGGYANYIATREGVDKMDDTDALAPATVRQKDFIQKLLRDFPSTRNMLEYADYKKKPNKGNATEFQEP